MDQPVAPLRLQTFRSLQQQRQAHQQTGQQTGQHSLWVLQTTQSPASTPNTTNNGTSNGTNNETNHNRTNNETNHNGTINRPNNDGPTNGARQGSTAGSGGSPALEAASARGREDAASEGRANPVFAGESDEFIDLSQEMIRRTLRAPQNAELPDQHVFVTYLHCLV